MIDVSEETAGNTIDLAAAEAEATTKPMKSSAMLCLEEARTAYECGAFTYAYNRAVDSLRYSVGIFHPSFVQAATR